MMVALLGVTACSGGAETDAPTSTVGVPACDTTGTVDDPNVLNGVYQVDWTYEDLAEATGLPREIVEENDGLITVTLFDGCFSTVWEEGTPCQGSYIVTSNRISWVATNRIADWGCRTELLGLEFSNTAWELTEDHLTLSDFEQIAHVDDITYILNRAVFGTKPLLRVEGAE